MYQLTHNGHPIGKPHPHRITCYIEALERGLVARGAGRYWMWGLTIIELEQGEDLRRDVCAARTWPRNSGQNATGCGQEYQSKGQPMIPLLHGMPVRIIHDMAKLQLSEHVMVTPEFRKEFNAWLKDMFPSNVMPDNQVLDVSGTLVMNPRTWAKVKQKLRGK